MYLAYDIEWDIDVEDVLEVLKEYSIKDIASILCIPEDIADILTIEQIEELVRKKLQKNQDLQREYFNLPYQVEIPRDIEKDDIEDWLSDQYGYCHKGYRLHEEN